MHKIILIISTLGILMLSSCGKTCSRQRSTLPHIDLSQLRPQGTFKGSDYTITFNADSTATVRYSLNNTNYELSYKVTKHGTHDITQIKY